METLLLWYRELPARFGYAFLAQRRPRLAREIPALETLGELEGFDGLLERELAGL